MKRIDHIVNCCLPCIIVEIWIRRALDFFNEPLRFMHVVGNGVFGLRDHSADMVVPGSRVNKVVLLNFKLIGDASGTRISCIGGAAGPDTAVEGLASLVCPGLGCMKAQVL
jgi:hypothetical protein